MGRNRQPTRETVESWRRLDSCSAQAGDCTGGWAAERPPRPGRRSFWRYRCSSAVASSPDSCSSRSGVTPRPTRLTVRPPGRASGGNYSKKSKRLPERRHSSLVPCACSRARRQAAEATTELAQAEKAARARARSLTPRLQNLTESAATLAGQSATLESELTALETYARHPGAAGLDAGYLTTQTRYLARSAAAATAAATALAQESRNAQAILHAPPR
jgi:hypothetical protein